MYNGETKVKRQEGGETMPLEVTSERDPRPEDAEAVRAGLLAFNVAHVGEPDYAPVNLFLRTPEGTVVGGLLGHRRWGWLYVDKLWIHEDYRGGGEGSRLLRQAEEEAIAAGCTEAVLDTFSYQARPFYEKHGYTVYAILEGYPPGYCQYFLRKTLVPAEPNSPPPPASHPSGHLPAAESLVRASAEPPAQQAEVLLRAAQGSQKTPQEQLLRSMNE